MSLLYCDPETSQINFPERTFVNIGICMISVILLIITAEVLDRDIAPSS